MRTASVRFRITALATILVAVVLAIAAVALGTVQRRSLVASVDLSLVQRLEEAAGDLERGVPDIIPNPTNDDHLVQFVARDGRVAAVSLSLEDAGPIAPSAETGSVYRTIDGLPVDDDVFRVLSAPIDTADGPGTIHVARSIDDLLDSVRILWISLAIFVPLVGLALAAVIWWLVGRALQSVDDIRREVASIGGGELNRRVPVPPSQDEIAELAATMNSMLDRLERASERERQFTADASHELRTPLTRVRTLLETASVVDLADPRVISEVLDELRHLDHLIRDLLFLARGESSPVRRPLDLDDIVLREVEAVRLASQVSVDVSGVSGAHLLGSSGPLTSAIRNLLENGARHAETTVSVRLEEVGSEIILTVTDDGTGIPAAERERIFDRFAQLDDARSSHGTGLGLAITKAVIADHGGSIDVTDGPDGGASFVIRLPASNEPSSASVD